MNLPFESEKEPEWKARNHIGRDDSLTGLERQMLDALDIIEQRQDRNTKMNITTHNRVVVIGALVLILVVLHGAEFVKIVRGWIGSGP